jgi:hypothetical protein
MTRLLIAYDGSGAARAGITVAGRLFGGAQAHVAGHTPAEGVELAGFEGSEGDAAALPVLVVPPIEVGSRA